MAAGVMAKMDRAEFIRLGSTGVAATLVPSALWGLTSGADQTVERSLLQDLVIANDGTVERYLTAGDRGPRGMFSRGLGEEFAVHTASFCQPGSKYYRSPQLLSRLDAIITKLAQMQYPSGMLDAGGNRQSPPDTAFLMDHLCPSYHALEQDASHGLDPLNEKLRSFLLRAGDGLRNGGVHTPNHRWEVSAALAQIYSVTRDERFVKRIDEWLAEGIDIDDDGNYSERSRLYAGVVDRSLLTIGRILGRPALFAPVKRNLETTYYYLESNGELVTIDSRRQDQFISVLILTYYLFYRYLALHFGDGRLAAITKRIEAHPEFSRRVLSRSLIFFMENPLLFKEPGPPDQLETRYTKFFPGAGLVRIRHEECTVSIFGGNDRPVEVASGRSTLPTFFTFRKGSAILEYARMSTAFFNTGYFRSEGVERRGNSYVLHERKEAYYYHPLPAEKRDPEGNYALTESGDGRFWSKMDFGARPKTTLSLESSVEVTPENGTYTLRFAVDGPKDVEVTLELCFRSGGTLEGTVPAGEADEFFLKDGTGRYTSGSDVIAFGPGCNGHANVRSLDGEAYTTHFGSVKGKGMHVYLTGLVPFSHTLTIR
jgi:hypothetical protein